MNKRNLLVLLSLSLVVSQGALAAPTAVDDRLKEYTAQGASNFSAKNGEAMWLKDFPDTEEPGKVRNCSTCHGNDLTKPGKHAKTGKVIDPLAPSANKERLTDSAFIEKWFKRNCKWVVNRECTPQEKGDFLMYLRDK